MIYGSVCSGIEAASVAWEPFGWHPAFFAEIDAFPSAVLAHRYPKVPNLGDFTRITPGRHEPIDLLVGGTPCQSFSIAGLRGGLEDDRGNLALEFLRLADRTRARWILWENVPGVLSSNGGRDFGSILGGLAELGYGFSYRVLDAQYVRVDGYLRAVPQRRRRVFVVGYLGDWRRAAAVLFERASLSGNSPPRREAGKAVAGTIGGSSQSGGFRTTDLDNTGAFIPVGYTPEIMAQAISSKIAKGSSGPAGDEHHHLIVEPIAIQERAICENPDAGPDGIGVRTDGLAYTLEARSVPQAIAFDPTQITNPNNRSNPQSGGPCHTLARGAHAPAIAFDCKASGKTAHSVGEVPGALRGDGFGGGHAAVAFKASHYTRGKDGAPSDVFPPLSADADKGDQDPLIFESRYARNGRGAPEEICPPLKARSGETGKGDSAPLLMASSCVRRLTPLECERLQGLPDNWTLVPYRNGQAADGPRYKAIGNSMAVNVMRWLGMRIQAVEVLDAKAA